MSNSPCYIAATNCLTLISLASPVYDIGKQCRPRSDATDRGVWVYTIRIKEILLKIKSKWKNALVQCIGLEKSISHIWVNWDLVIHIKKNHLYKEKCF